MSHRPGIPSPVGIQDPALRQTLLALIQSIDDLYHKLEQVQKASSTLPPTNIQQPGAKP